MGALRPKPMRADQPEQLREREHGGSRNRRWFPRAVLLGVVYLVAGVVFGTLAGAAGSTQMRFVWRLAAWVASAIAYAAHIGFEHFRERNPPPRTAIHVAAGAALGAFGLAVAANLHSLGTASGHQRVLLRVSLAVWPAVAGVPAFLVALAAASSLARLRRGRGVG